ncbi:hypothetical protein MAPG_05415 [Magnaporthiopsis poae ATCC 64411]|uniref:Adenosine deaminase domain-containing protein n=1 Tax=Magnaporthiopsis poae (strain ATCC 64411 / 73-15) TaxID=644358 RepID=A0A0C4DZC0_MAGP6|nr:hypothetical protein MAPG_05415 [Magnaporthiopsis poae ATCC 64411]
MSWFTDEEWAETEKEIPQPADGLVQKYLQGREGLVAQEASQRSDHAFRQSLSPIARRACAIVDRIRADEMARVWTPQLEEAIATREAGNVTVHPGMMFGLAKDAMETTELWRVVRRMPKGALLHAHNDAMVDFGFLIGVVLDTPGMHVACRDSHLATDDARRERVPAPRVGFDVVGQKDKGPPLKTLFPILAWFRKLCADEGVTIPLFLHAGETLGDGTETDGNLFDAVLLGARRVGHAFSLYKHPLLVELVKDRRILVESCPISNEVLRLCSSVTAHPLPALLARGVPCALSNDDPGMLGHDTAGATHDFWSALQGWDNLGLAGLGSLAENSVRWAAFEDENDAAWVQGVKEASLGSGVKAQRLKEWAVAWEEFCLWVVTEYGDRYPDEEEMVDAAG